MFVAMQKGVARGIFSNESGLGSAPIAAAAARTKEPGSSGTCFYDRNIHRYNRNLYNDWSFYRDRRFLAEPELEGVAITMDAFQKGLPFPSFVATFS